MNPLSVAVLGTLITSGVLAGATAVIYTISQARSLRSWAIAWVFNSGWLAGELVMALGSHTWWVVGPAMLLRLASALFLFQGTMQYLHRPVRPVAYVLFGTAASWIVAAWLLQAPFAVTVAAAAVFLSGALLCMGINLLRSAGKDGGMRLIGVAAVILSLHHLDYIVLRQTPVALVGFLVLMGLLLSIGIGLVTSYQERIRRHVSASEERFRSLVSSVDDIVFLLDREGRHLEIHGRWPEHELIPREAYIGRTAAEVIGDDEGRIHLEYHRRAMAQGPQRFEWAFTDRSGRRWVEITLSPVRDDAARVVGTVGVSRDITHLKETQRRLQEEIAQKRILVKEIHHRSKNNMQVMSSILLLQARRLTNDDQKGALVESARRIETMASVHEHLYAQENVAEIEMGSFARQMVERLTRLYARPESGIVARVESEAIYFPLDIALPCAQILQELISNALTHAFQGCDNGLIVVAIRRAGEHRIEVSVRDTGRGLPAEMIDTEGRIRETASLGLLLVDLLAHQLDAHLSVVTDHGTAVTLRIPLPRSTAQTSVCEMS